MAASSFPTTTTAAATTMASSLRAFMNLTQTCTRQRISLFYTQPHSTNRAFSFSSRVLSSSPYTKEYIPPAKSPLSILEDDNAEVDLSEDNDLVNGVRPGTPPIHARMPSPKATPAEWRKHREAIKERFPDGWSPPRKISREAMAGLRQLHKLNPETFTTQVLADKFKISPEAVRRILKSKWEPSKERKELLLKKEKAALAEKRGKAKNKVVDMITPFVAHDEPEDGEDGKRPRKKKRDRLEFV